LNLAGRETCAPFPPVALALDGEVDALLEQQPALAAEEVLRERLAAGRTQDAEGGGASSGPQRSDLSVTHLGRQLPAAHCSTGEQKALLLSLVLAQSRLLALDRGTPPLLLLDEVVAHLDAAHRRALFDQVLGLGAQAWMSGTEREPFAELEGAADFFGVADAQIVRQSPYTT
ncbi:MAG: DNA replication/repair protein RecF, partial [Kiloniellales bacterium]